MIVMIGISEVLVTFIWHAMKAVLKGGLDMEVWLNERQ